MAAKKGALLLFALAAIFASAAAFASIPRSALPDSKQIAHQTSALGVPTRYTDQVSQATAITDKDSIGRPVRREYADGTFEHFEWEGPRIHSYTNRQGQTVTYDYYPIRGNCSGSSAAWSSTSSVTTLPASSQSPARRNESRRQRVR